MCLLIGERFIFSSKNFSAFRLKELVFGGWDGGCGTSVENSAVNGGNSSIPALLQQQLVQMAAFIKTLAYVNILKFWLVSLRSSWPFVVAIGGAVVFFHQVSKANLI